MQDDGSRADQAAGFDIESNMVQPVRQDGMFAPGDVGCDRQPRGKLGRIHGIEHIRTGAFADDGKRARIEFGMPNDPRIRRATLRILGESESPTAQGREPGGRSPLHASRCSPGVYQAT